MKMKFIKTVFMVSTLCILPAAWVYASSHIVEMSVESVFEDVSIDIDNAIANRGFVVDYKGHVGEMLNRTADDVGSSNMVYLYADTWQFCSSVLSRQMVEINPSNIAYCPYIIYAFELTSQPGTVVVGFRKHETQDSASEDILRTIDDQLEMIIKEATE